MTNLRKVIYHAEDTARKNKQLHFQPQTLRYSPRVTTCPTLPYI